MGEGRLPIHPNTLFPREERSDGDSEGVEGGGNLREQKQNSSNEDGSETWIKLPWETCVAENTLGFNLWI